MTKIQIIIETQYVFKYQMDSKWDTRNRVHHSDDTVLLREKHRAHPCSRHEHWHTGDFLTNLFGLLVNGFRVCVFRLVTGVFLDVRKAPGPICVRSNVFPVICLKSFLLQVKRSRLQVHWVFFFFCHGLFWCLVCFLRGLEGFGKGWIFLLHLHTSYHAQGQWFLLTSDFMISFSFCRKPS